MCCAIGDIQCQTQDSLLVLHILHLIPESEEEPAKRKKNKKDTEKKKPDKLNNKVNKTEKNNKRNNDDDDDDIMENENLENPFSDDEVSHLSGDEDGDEDIGDDFGDEHDIPVESKTKEKPDVWEDIYGRKRDKEGNVIKVIHLVVK